MKFAPAILCVLLACGNTGCLSVCNNAHRTLFREPAQFSWRKDRCQSKVLYRSWADEAWSEQLANGCGLTSADYLAGFQEGFVEYCYAGGTGEPPPVPPRPYWNPLNRTSLLKDGAQEWFAGYRLGARVAQEGGYRQEAIAPYSGSPSGCATRSCNAVTSLRGNPLPHIEPETEEYDVVSALNSPAIQRSRPPNQPALVQPSLNDSIKLNELVTVPLDSSSAQSGASQLVEPHEPVDLPLLATTPGHRTVPTVRKGRSQSVQPRLPVEAPPMLMATRPLDASAQVEQKAPNSQQPAQAWPAARNGIFNRDFVR